MGNRYIYVDVFQSHAGSIEARIALLVALRATNSFNPTLVRLRPIVPARGRLPKRSFNPTLVRLRLRLRADYAVKRAVVSIPRWFD